MGPHMNVGMSFSEPPLADSGQRTHPKKPPLRGKKREKDKLLRFLEDTWVSVVVYMVLSMHFPWLSVF